MRIYIIGNSGSGKTTLAWKLSNKLNIPYLELDSLGDWNASKFLDDINIFITSNSDWIVEGIYNHVSKPISDVSDFLIYLDIDKEEMKENIYKYTADLNRRKFLESYYQDKRYSKNKILIYSQGAHNNLYDKYTKEKIKIKTRYSKEYDEVHKII